MQVLNEKETVKSHHVLRHVNERDVYQTKRAHI